MRGDDLPQRLAELARESSAYVRPSPSGEQSGGVAFWAHLGGFVAGVVLVKVFERRDRVAAHTSHHWRPREAGWR